MWHSASTSLGRTWVYGSVAALPSWWLLGLIWVWLAHGSLAATLGACTEFGRATLLESWELALSLVEQPCCRAGMMVVASLVGMLLALRRVEHMQDKAGMFC